VSKEEGATPPDQIIVFVDIMVPSFRLTVFGVAPITRRLRIISIPLLCSLSNANSAILTHFR
jgi:hypothetical protein